MPSDDELAAEIVALRARGQPRARRRSAPSAGCASSTAGTCAADASARTCASALATATTVDEVERLLIEAAPGAVALIEHSDREIAALGDIEDDSYLDLPISIYAGG